MTDNLAIVRAVYSGLSQRKAATEYYEFPEPPNLLKKSHSIFYIEPLV